MQLTEINPERYRQRLNKVIFACIGTLTIGSLGISQLLILLMPSSEGSHFHWNLFGVVVTSLVVLITLLKLKSHDFFYEVSYVWDLKQALNKINRRIKKIEAAAKQGDTVAMQILHFSYSASRQLWELDNNTITLGHLASLEKKLQELADTHQVTLDINQYNSTQLANY
ncbi:DUF3087 domain-containing protein [Psychromonas sp. RZ22]|uniref:DUF3087 domain-containing protein n=1 Tax=Psychromonas algarum TaxID=2555643 RepID=UPI0010687F1E|nr:DUF3087 domain-containing protein [Psychromonas sp. RZ22]TEW53634.1 DUF3087 domain-containing protein [Psychromonas sp. RZ22]